MANEIERRLEGLGDGGGDPMLQAMNEFRRGQIEAMEVFHDIPVVLSLKTNWEGTIWGVHLCVRLHRDAFGLWPERASRLRGDG